MPELLHKFLTDVTLAIPTLTILTWWFQKRLEAKFSRELETTRHQLQLEYQRMSVIYDHQKDSFRKIIVAIHGVVDAIRRRADSTGEHWPSIDSRPVDELRRVIAEEAIFVDSDCAHALAVAVRFASLAVEDETGEPSTEQVYRTYKRMELIAEAVSNHFRVRVGLSASTERPLSDIELLGASYILNGKPLTGFRLDKGSPLHVSGDESTLEQVAKARNNLPELRRELLRLKEICQQGRERLFFSLQSEVNWYISKLDEVLGPRV